MRLIYLAHPVSPLDGETVESNLASAERWLVGLSARNPDAVFLAPWIQALRLGIGDDSDPVSRELGLQGCEAVAAACDEIVLCGPRVSRGMARERSACGGRAWRLQDHAETLDVLALDFLHEAG